MFTPDLIAGDKLKLYIGCERGQVIMDFGAKLSHMEMTPAEAMQISEKLRTWARVAVVQAPTELDKLTIAATGTKP